MHDLLLYEFMGLCVSSMSPWHPTCMRVYLSSRKGKIVNGAKVKITPDKKSLEATIKICFQLANHYSRAQRIYSKLPNKLIHDGI